MTSFKNHTFLPPLPKHPLQYTPISIIPQPGPYLPQYKPTPPKPPTFLHFSKNTQFATQLTIHPLHPFHFHPAILFSHILTLPD
ncbi:uroporphyrinogen decarboxylase family protein, partial [Neisseria sicca]|uniref:uroporphyrinogen decarboxylase family protein n=1 Tax=Neisseria sicca TaxID=490 RepID=UPI0034D959D4